MKKVTNKAAFVVLTSLLALPLTAGLSAAADKLVVQDGSANNVFTVDDAGNINNAGKLGVGSLQPATSQITIVDETGSLSRGLGAYQATSDTMAGVVDFRKMRGAYTDTPTAANAVNTGDYVGAFHAWGVDPTGVWRRGATINYYVDAPPTNGGVPIALLFSTGTNDNGLANPKVPRMIIGSDGTVTVKDLVGTGNAYVCVDSNGVLSRSTSPCL